jgi:hypothetical protein
MARQGMWSQVGRRIMLTAAGLGVIILIQVVGGGDGSRPRGQATARGPSSTVAVWGRTTASSAT